MPRRAWAGLAVTLFVAHVGAGVAAGAGRTPSSPQGRAIRQLERDLSRPVPTTPRRPVDRQPTWVPERTVPMPGHAGGVRVPGHWEFPYDDDRVRVPPLTVCDRATGECRTVPGGVRPPADERRQAP